jgi:AraC-like DNA-binding protein
MSDIEYTDHMLDLGEDNIRVMKCNLDKSVGLHRHDFVEIAFLARGSCIHSYQDSEIMLIPGDVFTIAPRKEHSYKITDKTVIYNCLFYPAFLDNDWNRLNQMKGVFDFLYVEPYFREEIKEQTILHLDINETNYLESILELMLEEQSSKDEYYPIVQKATLLTVICFLGRSWEKQHRRDRKIHDGKRDLLACAIKYIEENLDSELIIDEIASKAYLNPTCFRKKFRELTGMSPVDYINRLRISKARSLLKENIKSISDVASSVGINDPNYFARLFKSLENISPSRYKKNLNNAKKV